MKISRDEFDKLALEHLDMLHRVALRLTHDASKADDLVQDTYERAYRAREDFVLQEYGIRPWLVRIMQNIHFSRRQREKRQPAAMDEAHLEQIEKPPDPTGPAGTINFEGMDEQLVKALNEQPQEYQTVLLLWAVEGFSYKEIADATDVPIGTVMSRLYRARAKLAERLQEYAKKERIIRE